MLGVIDTGAAPEVYVDGIGSVDDLGDTFRTIYFTFARIPGSTIFQRMAVVKIVRPKSAFAPGTIASLLAAGNATALVPHLMHS